MAKTSVLTPQSEDFPRWYQDAVAKAELAENGPVRGTMVIRPYGWAIWEEGHTCHSSENDARSYALRILHEVYEDFIVNVLGLPVLSGLKSKRETFAGAENSWTCEAMMGDGKALQMCTSHLLGQNFAK